MKHFLFLLISVVPVWVLAQTDYTVAFADLKDNDDNKNLVITTHTVNSENFLDAKIIITGVAAGNDADIKLQYADDETQEVSGNFDAATGTFIFDVGRELEPSNGKFRLVYKGKLNGIYRYNGTFTEPQINQDDEDGLTTYIAAIANANFVGNNKFLSNLTPVINLGGIVTLSEKSWGKANEKKGTEENSKHFTWGLDINPYIGGQIETEDSISFIPAMMLSGRAGIGLNNYLSWGGDKIEFTWMPLGFGLKIIPGMRDSTVNIWQHNFRTGVSLRYKDQFILGAQYTYGFHNTTSESHHFFNELFSSGNTEIKYLTISGQFLVNSKNEEDRSNFLFIDWRGLLNKKKYEFFTNNAIITVGFRKDLALSNTFATAVAVGTTKKKRPSIF